MQLSELLRVELEQLGLENSRRLFHGRGKQFPAFSNIAIDWYAPVLLLVSYNSESVPLLYEFGNSLKNHPIIGAVVLQQRSENNSTKELLWGEMPEDHKISEQGLLFVVNMEENLNHGFFFDTANVRRKVEEIAKDRRVLNLFSYSCAFSLYALRGGATHVINMDMSKGALRIGRVNHRLNDVEKSLVTFLEHDIMKSFGKIDRLGPYDLVILDPPTFQAGSFDYKKDYIKILRRVLPNLASGGELILCLNSPDESEEFLLNLISQFDLKVKESLPLAEGFYEIDQSRGLKAIRVSYS